MKNFGEPKPKTVEWYTPPEIFKALDCSFDLDPASPGKDIVHWIPAQTHYTEFGLMKEWFGRIWLNPPYGRETEQWLQKLKEHNNGIALVFARTDTGWFHNIAIYADVLCFTKGRIPFIDKNGKVGKMPSCGSLFLAFGLECAEILHKANLGYCVDNRLLI